MESAELAKYIDHTLLKADAAPQDIEHLVEEAKTWGVTAVCINSGYVKVARQTIGNYPLRLASTIGFPLGQMSPKGKYIEASTAIEDGADELDLVWNLGLFLSGDLTTVESEIVAIAKMCETTNTLLKVILESALLSPEQIETGTRLVVNAGADMVKTSTGFGYEGATEIAVQKMRQVAPPNIGIKAAGGIRTKDSAERFIQLGATRIGTSSTKQILGLK